MSVTNMAMTAALLMGAAVVVAQGPVRDKVVVTFPNPVIVAGKALPAGEYTVRQIESTASPRVLEFTSDDGTEVQATVSTIPMETNNPRDATGVILEQRGNNYYVSKIWVQGQRYGYQFAPPEAREDVMRVVRVEGIRMTGEYKPAEEPKQVAQAQPPEPKPEPTPTPQPEPTPKPQPEPTPEPEPTSPPVREPEPAPQPVREPTPTPAMPETAAHWMALLLGGTGLSAAGWGLRRKAQR